MYSIVKKRVLNENVTLMEIEAPLVAAKALPGQFIIFRIDEEGERIPLTIAGYDREKGTVTIIFQKVGYSTEKLDTLNEGDALLDFVGPLGEPSHTDGIKKTAVIGGGLTGCEIAYELALKGKNVAIVEMKDDIVKQTGVCLANSSYLREYFALHKVPVFLESSVSEVKDGNAVVTNLVTNAASLVPCDTVITSIGYTPAPLAPKGKNIHLVGDCGGIGNLRSVIWRAYETAMKL